MTGKMTAIGEGRWKTPVANKVESYLNRPQWKREAIAHLENIVQLIQKHQPATTALYLTNETQRLKQLILEVGAGKRRYQAKSKSVLASAIQD